MSLNNIIQTSKRDLIRAFAMLDAWFDKEEAFYRYKPPGNNSSVFRMLARASTINHFLLSKISGSDKDLPGQEKLQYAGASLDSIANEQFAIRHPGAHVFLDELHSLLPEDEAMPGGFVREMLRDQLYHALCHLDLLQNGADFLYPEMPSAVMLHKQKNYQLINLITANVWRQVQALIKVEVMFNRQMSAG